MKALTWLDGAWGRRLFLAGLVIALVGTLYFRVRFVDNYTLNTGGYDQNIVYGTVRIMNGTPLYTDPEQPPFPIIQYGPLHMRLMATIATAVGVHPDDVQGVYIAMRIAVLVLNLLALGVLYLLCSRLGCSRNTSMGVAIFFFASMAVFYYMRPDSLYILFFLLHVYTMVPVVRAPHGTAGWRRMIMPVLFGVAAVLTKQTGVLIFLLAGTWFVQQRRWKELGTFIAIAVATGGVGLGVLAMEGGIANAYRNIVLGVMNDVGLKWIMSMIASKYFLIGVPVSALGLWAAIPWLRQGSSPVNAYIALGAVVSLLWATLTGLKAGMNINYFTEHYTFAVIAMAMACEHGLNDQVSTGLRRVFMILVPALALLRTAMQFSAFEITHYHADRPGTYRAEQEVVRELELHGSRPDEYIALWHRGYMELFLPERTLLDQKDILYKSERDLQLDFGEFHRMADDGRLKYVVAPVHVEEIMIVGRNFDHYVPCFRTDSFQVRIHPRFAERTR